MNDIDKMNIDEMNAREIRAAIALELGLDPTDINNPDWTTSADAAMTLDGDGWLWRTIETPYGVEVFNQFAASGVYVLFADFPTKAAACAIARCRAWLKARQKGAQ